MLDPRRLEAELSDLLTEIGVPPDWLPEQSAGPQGDPPASPAAVGEEPAPGHRTAPIETAMDLLRLLVQYLLFDLEATRRENGSLRKMLQERREEQES